MTSKFQVQNGRQIFFEVVQEVEIRGYKLRIHRYIGRYMQIFSSRANILFTKTNSILLPYRFREEVILPFLRNKRSREKRLIEGL